MQDETPALPPVRISADSSEDGKSINHETFALVQRIPSYGSSADEYSLWAQIESITS